jgi:pimeloyl-ACP methyl ester carboxylesterase
MRTPTWLKASFAAVTLALALGGVAAGPAAADPTPPGFRHGDVAVDGGDLHYVRGGSGPALVLLPGWPETWLAWHKVMPALARDHTVIAFDLPGLGRSDIPSDGFDAATTAERIRQGVHRLGFEKVAILGHDLGALIAYPYAAEHPGEVTRIGVVESTLNGFGLEQAYGLSWHFGFNAAPKPVPEQIIDDKKDVRTYLGWLFSGARYPEAIPQEAYFDAYASPARRSAGYEYYRAFPANAAYNQARSAQKLTLPVLAIGAQDVFGPAIAASFREVATDVREVVAPDSGHWIPLENPAFLASCAASFFAPADHTPPPGPQECAR